MIPRPRTTTHRVRARPAHEALRPRVAERAAAALDERDTAALLARFDRFLPACYEPLNAVYGGEHRIEALLARLFDCVVDAAVRRPPALRLLDHRREIDPEWFRRESTVGYVCYVDRFAGTLAGVRERVDYLRELGVTYLHLMPLLAPRAGPDDGGYAVADYRTVDPRVGNLADVEALATTLRAHGISLCLDLVVNHTAREHEWARRARAGEPRYRDYYLLFDDRELPDAYEASLPEVFPDTAPGNFTWVPELDAWVWTTFHDYQWDLNWANPNVCVEMLDVMLFLANLGVEVLRLDAVPFLWKRLGTDCQNQPEAHLLLEALRALVRIGAPGVVFKAEAIVSPDELVAYLGGPVQVRAGPTPTGTPLPPVRTECDLAYNNQLMVMLWSGVAARDAGLPAHALARMAPPPPGTAWVTYVRCHDDIGWAVTDDDAAAVGLDAGAHRRFLNDFYAGTFDGSFARGVLFQPNPVTGDARISGTTAALCGVSQARAAGDEHLLDQAIRRLLLLYGVICSYGGTPLIYMGDELALDNDLSYLDDPETAADNRWVHRPSMDWAAAARRHDPATVEGRVFAGLRRLLAVRVQVPELHADARVRPVPTGNRHVFGYVRLHPSHGSFVGLANFADGPQPVDARPLAAAGLDDPVDVLAADEAVAIDGGRLVLPGLGLAWLVDARPRR